MLRGMRKKPLFVVVVAVAAVLLLAGVIGVKAWQGHQRHEAMVDRFVTAIAEDAAATPTVDPFDEDTATRECQSLHALSSEGLRLRGVTYEDASSTQVAEGLYSLSGYAVGENGRDGYSCTAMWDGASWEVELI